MIYLRNLICYPLLANFYTLYQACTHLRYPVTVASKIFVIAPRILCIQYYTTDSVSLYNMFGHTCESNEYFIL